MEALLGLSVMSQCYRCTKLLLDFGADVNQPLEYNEAIEGFTIERKLCPKTGVRLWLLWLTDMKD